jgi:ketosteroid isomerase-like protein
MSEHHAEVLRKLYDAFNRRDMGALLECLDPEVEIDETEDLAYAAQLLRVLGPRFVILSGGYHGHEEVRTLFETVWEISDRFVVEPDDFMEAGETVILSLAMRARARDSGVQGEAHTVHLWTMKDGRGSRLRVYAHRDEALRAAALEDAADQRSS